MAYLIAAILLFVLGGVFAFILFRRPKNMDIRERASGVDADIDKLGEQESEIRKRLEDHVGEIEGMGTDIHRLKEILGNIQARNGSGNNEEGQADKD